MFLRNVDIPTLTISNRDTCLLLIRQRVALFLPLPHLRRNVSHVKRLTATPRDPVTARDYFRTSTTKTISISCSNWITHICIQGVTTQDYTMSNQKAHLPLPLLQMSYHRQYQLHPSNFPASSSKLVTWPTFCKLSVFIHPPTTQQIHHRFSGYSVRTRVLNVS